MLEILLVLTLLILPCVEGQVVEINGNVTLIGLLNYRGTVPGKTKCSVIRPSDGLLLAIAMKNAVERVNNDTKILPNIQIGLKIFDVCEAALLQNTALRMLWTENIVGVLGPTHCEDTSTVGVAMSLFHIPMITYNEIPLKIDYRKYFEIQHWAVPDIIHSIHALQDFISHMNWNFIGLFYQNNDYGWAVARDMLSHSSHGWPICFTNMIIKDIGTSSHEYSLEFFTNFIAGGDPRVRVVVLFLEEAEIVKFVQGLELLHKDVVSQYTFLSLSTWGTKQLPVLNANKNYARGVITFQPYYKPDEQFEQYFHSEQFRNEELVKNYTKHICMDERQNLLKKPCNLSSHDLKKRFGNISHSKVSAVTNSVYAFASTFHYFDFRNQSQNISKSRREMNRIMRNLTMSADLDKIYPFRKDLFEFQLDRRIKPLIGIYNYQKISETEYAYKKIGEWSLDKEMSEINYNNSRYFGTLDLFDIANIQWGADSKPPLSTCSVPCGANQVKILIPRLEACCNTCHTCKGGEVISNNTCTPCNINERPNQNLTFCEKLPENMVYVNSTIVSITVTLSCIGIVMTLTAFSIFFYYRHEHIVKAFSRELNCFIFLGILSLCSVPLLTFYKVSHIVCFMERLQQYIGFTFVFAPLFLKTNRVYRIFQAAHSSTVSPKVVSPMSQILITLLFCGVQVLLCIPRLSLMKIGYLYPTHKQYVEIYCQDDLLIFSINFTYVVILMGATTFYAFKTRHFPKNYNESKYIGFTMYITCFLCAIGLVAYFLVPDRGTKNVVLSLACLICACVVLFGLFFHKLHSVYTNQRVVKNIIPSTEEKTKTQSSNIDYDVTSVNNTDSPRLWDLRRLSSLSILKTSPQTVTKKSTVKENDYATNWNKQTGKQKDSEL